MKIYFNEATKLLKDQNNVLVRFEYWNGIIRSKEGEEKGELSTKMVDKLIDKNKLEFICNCKYSFNSYRMGLHLPPIRAYAQQHFQRNF